MTTDVASVELSEMTKTTPGRSWLFGQWTDPNALPSGELVRVVSYQDVGYLTAAIAANEPELVRRARMETEVMRSENNIARSVFLRQPQHCVWANAALAPAPAFLVEPATGKVAEAKLPGEYDKMLALTTEHAAGFATDFLTQYRPFTSAVQDWEYLRDRVKADGRVWAVDAEDIKAGRHATARPGGGVKIPAFDLHGLHRGYWKPSYLRGLLSSLVERGDVWACPLVVDLPPVGMLTHLIPFVRRTAL